MKVISKKKKQRDWYEHHFNDILTGLSPNNVIGKSHDLADSHIISLIAYTIMQAFNWDFITKRVNNDYHDL